jgi:hypothetical protein
MRTLTSLPILLTATCLTVAGGCHSRAESDRPAAPAEGAVGFELPGNTPVARGALLTKPPGREEAFVPFVAVGASTWVDTCRGQAGSTPPLFTFTTDARGALRPPAADAGITARDRCLAARAAASSAPPGLPPATHVTVQLALRAP